VEFVALGFECLDAVPDGGGVDAGFDRAQLEFDSVVDVSDSALQSIALVAAFASEFSCECRALFQEPGDSLLAEHVLLEEAVDDGKEGVLADVLPPAVAQRFRRPIAVGDAVRAGVVGDALAFLPVHSERLWPVAQWTIPRSW
jgi:hypothetical protein